MANVSWRTWGYAQLEPLFLCRDAVVQTTWLNGSYGGPQSG